MITTALRRRLDAEDGLTLVEVMVAISVLAVVMAGVASSVTTALRMTQVNQGRVKAANIAQYELERLRAIPFQAWVDNPAGRNIEFTNTLDGITYNVIRRAEFVTEGTTVAGCTDNPAYVLVEQTIEFNSQLSGEEFEAISNRTIIRPPVATYDAFTGHICVNVIDRDGLPQRNIHVRVSGPSGLESEFTDAAGTAFLTFLDPGQYDVTLDRDGYIDYDTQVQVGELQVTVVPATTQSVTFSYDEGAEVEIDVVSQPGATVPEDLVFTASNGAFTPTARLLPDGCIPSGPFCATPQPLRNITPLPYTVPYLFFPYAGGLSVHAGRCAAADPAAGGAAAASAPTEPGESNLVLVELPAVGITVGAGGEHDVVARMPADSGCADGDEIFLGTTSASGTLTSAIPYGPWEIEATPLGPGTARSATVTIDATSTGTTVAVAL